MENNLSVLNWSPLELLDPDGNEVEGGGNDQGLDTQSLSFVVFWFRGPVEEGGNILGHLGGGGRGTVFVFNQVIKQNSTHGNGTTWEVRVVVGAWWQLDTGRRLVRVTSQQGEDVIAGTVSGLDDQRQVWWVGTLVGSSGSLFVGVRTWDVVGQLTWSLLRVTFVIRFVVVLEFLSHLLGFCVGVGDTDKVSPSDSVKRVAGSTDFSVDLETSSNGGVVEGVEHTVVGPTELRWVQTVLGSGHGLGLLGVSVKRVGGNQPGGSNRDVQSGSGLRSLWLGSSRNGSLFGC